MTKTRRFFMVVSILLLANLACAGSMVTSVPTSSPNEIATVVAATMQYLNSLATPTVQPAAASPTAIPATATLSSFPPTAVLPNATRINFLTGATTGEVKAPIAPGQSQNYVLYAMQGQPMIATLDSDNNDVTMSIKTAGGTSLLNHGQNLNMALPVTEDYYITVFGGTSIENFQLDVQIPAIIKFAIGKNSAIRSGKTVGGFIVSYVVNGQQDQKMDVELNGTGGNAVLAVYGFGDGQPYLRYVAEQNSFSMKLPSTQDYILQVYPRAGQVVNYTLVVYIQ